MGVMEPSSASEWFDSQDDTLTESILSPELPLVVDLCCSLVGVFPGMMSDPRNSRLSLFTMLFRGLGDVVLASAAASTSTVLPPVYNQQNEDTCIIRISVEDNGNMYKSIMLTSQDKTPAVIQRAMSKHNLESDPAEEYELVQVISEDKELVIPDSANVFYAMNSQVNFDFILGKKNSVEEQVKLRSRISLTLPRTAKQGCWSNRHSKITL